MVEAGAREMTRDITFKASRRGPRPAHRRRGCGGRRASRSSTSPTATFLMHLGGKIEVNGRVPVKTRDDLSMAYTPGVARVCMAIHDDPEKVYNLTIKQNTVAVVTDGSAVLGLGDIGPARGAAGDGGQVPSSSRRSPASTPSRSALDTKDVDEIVRTVKAIAPVFGGINLEDISAPALLRDRGAPASASWTSRCSTTTSTAPRWSTLAALINALKVVNKKLYEVKIVFTGAGGERHRHRQAPDAGGRAQHRRVRPGGHAVPRPHGEHEPDEDVVRRAHQPRQPPRHGERRHGRAPTCSSACPAPAW